MNDNGSEAFELWDQLDEQLLHQVQQRLAQSRIVQWSIWRPENKITVGIRNPTFQKPDFFAVRFSNGPKSRCRPPNHGSSNGSAFDSRSKGPWYKSCKILLDFASKLLNYFLHKTCSRGAMTLEVLTLEVFQKRHWRPSDFGGPDIGGLQLKYVKTT